MSENVVLMIANVLVIFAWVFSATFVYRYAKLSDWRVQLVGRVVMYKSISMLTLLTYALAARWLQPIDELNYILGLGTYAFLAAMLGMILLVLVAVQKDIITAANPNPSIREIVRLLWRSRKDKKTNG